MARATFTARSAGSFAPAVVSDEQRAAVAPLPWSWLKQVHGTGLFRVSEPGEVAGQEGDALLTTEPGCAVAVQVADCAPVLLVGGSTLAVVHAGWRGVAGGILERAVDAVRAADDGEVFAVVGPHIGPECYEFGPAELTRLEDLLGPEVRGRTTWGTAALDLGAAVRLALSRSGVNRSLEVGACTSCHPDRYFSHRARSEAGRHAMVAWLEFGP